MSVLKKALVISGKCFLTLVLFVLFIASATEISPVFDFEEPSPFSGSDVFNPYAALDTSIGWKRANFHTHTKVDGLLNECGFTPREVYDSLDRLGYDIVTFSNHNELTEHPFDTSLQVNVYEHGYNLFKYHKLVFGSEKVNRYDNLFPFLISQKQYQLDCISHDCDFILLNHPFRTLGTTQREMSLLTGYSIIELDSGVSTENEYWDWALSAGHYSFALANDDLHHPDRSDCIAVRCNFLNTPSARYADIRKTLMQGNYYCMRIPDYGNGNPAVKYEGNRHLPSITDIGLDGRDSVFISLSRPASSIVFYGQNHSILHKSDSVSASGYRFKDADSYVRITAFFDDGCVIYTNPFARYVKPADSPYTVSPHSENLVLSLLYNMLVFAVCGLWALCAVKLWRKKH